MVNTREALVTDLTRRDGTGRSPQPGVELQGQ